MKKATSSPKWILTLTDKEGTELYLYIRTNSRAEAMKYYELYYKNSFPDRELTKIELSFKGTSYTALERKIK